MPIEKYSVEVTADLRKFNESLNLAIRSLQRLAEVANQATARINASISKTNRELLKVSESVDTATRTTERSTRKQESAWDKIWKVIKKINRFLKFMARQPEIIEKELTKPIRGFYHLVRQVEIAARMFDRFGKLIIRAFLKFVPLPTLVEKRIWEITKAVSENIEKFREFTDTVRKGTADILWDTEKATRRYFDFIDVLVAVRDMFNEMAKYAKISGVAILVTAGTAGALYGLARAVGLTAREMGTFGKLVSGVGETMRGMLPMLDENSALLRALGRHIGRVTTGFRLFWTALEDIIAGFKIMNVYVAFGAKNFDELETAIRKTIVSTVTVKDKADALVKTQEALNKMVGDATDFQLRLASAFVTARERLLGLIPVLRTTGDFIRRVLIRAITLLIANIIMLPDYFRLATTMVRNWRASLVLLTESVKSLGVYVRDLSVAVLDTLVKRAIEPVMRRFATLVGIALGVRDQMGGLAYATMDLSDSVVILGRNLREAAIHPATTLRSVVIFLGKEIKALTITTWDLTTATLKSGLTYFRTTKVADMLRSVLVGLFGTIDKTVESFGRAGEAATSYMAKGYKVIEITHKMQLGTFGLIDSFARLTMRIAIVSGVLTALGRILEHTRIRVVETIGAIMTFVGVALVKLESMLVTLLKTAGRFIEVIGIRMINYAKKLLISFLETEDATFRFKVAIDALSSSMGKAAPTADEMDEYVRKLAITTGFARTEIYAAAGLLMELARACGFGREEVKELLRISIDLAAQFHGPLQDTVLAVTGAFRGITRSLDVYGISMRDASVANEMLGEAGMKLWRQMTVEEKQRLRLNYLIKESEAFRGVAEKRIETMTGALESLHRTMEESNRIMGAGIAKVLRPFVVIIAKINRYMVASSSIISEFTGVAISMLGIVTYILGAFIRWSMTVITLLGAWRLLNLTLEYGIPILGKLLSKYAFGEKLIKRISETLVYYRINWKTAHDLIFSVLRETPRLIASAFRSVVMYTWEGIKTLGSWTKAMLANLTIVKTFKESVTALGIAMDSLRLAVSGLLRSQTAMMIAMETGVGVAGRLREAFKYLGIAVLGFGKALGLALGAMLRVMAWVGVIALISGLIKAFSTLDDTLRRLRKSMDGASEGLDRTEKSLRDIDDKIKETRGYLQHIWMTFQRIGEFLLVGFQIAITAVVYGLSWLVGQIMRLESAMLSLIGRIPILGRAFKWLSEIEGKAAESTLNFAESVRDMMRSATEDIKLLWKDFTEGMMDMTEKTELLQDRTKALEESIAKLEEKHTEHEKAMAKALEKIELQRSGLLRLGVQYERVNTAIAGNIRHQLALMKVMLFVEKVMRDYIGSKEEIQPLIEITNALIKELNEGYKGSGKALEILNRYLDDTRWYIDQMDRVLRTSRIRIDEHTEHVNKSAESARDFGREFYRLLDTLRDGFQEFKRSEDAIRRHKAQQEAAKEVERRREEAIKATLKSMGMATRAQDEVRIRIEKALGLYKEEEEALRRDAEVLSYFNDAMKKLGRTRDGELESLKKMHESVIEGISLRYKDAVAVESFTEGMKKLTEEVKDFRKSLEEGMEAEERSAVETAKLKAKKDLLKLSTMKSNFETLKSIKLFGELTIGMLHSADAVGRLDILTAGMTEEQIKYVKTILGTVSAFEKQIEATEGVMEAQHRYAYNTARLKDLTVAAEKAMEHYRIGVELGKLGVISASEVQDRFNKAINAARAAIEAGVPQSERFRLAIAKMKEATVKTSEAFTAIKDKVVDAMYTMVDAVSRAVVGMETDWKSMLRSMAAEWISFIIKLAIEEMIEKFKTLSKVSREFGEATAGAAKEAGAEWKGLVGVLGALGGMILAIPWERIFGAGGGTVAKGVRLLQKGGIVQKPTLAVLGEGGNPEAIVPLQEGAVPVKFLGNPEEVRQVTNVNIEIRAIDTQTGLDYLMRNQGAIAENVMRATMGSISGRKAIRRVM